MARGAGAAALLGLWLSASATTAERMQVVPGLWEFRNSSAVPLALPAVPPVQRRCVAESEVDPEALLREAPGCALSAVESTAYTLRWKVACDHAGARLTGEGSARSTGRALQGSVRLATALGGQPVEVLQTWEGRRIGDCRPGAE